MVLRVVAGVRRGEDTHDLREYLARLPGGPRVDETVVLGCDGHGDDRPTWVYVEADATAGVARRRCLQCARSVGLLDSDARWTHPPMWACGSCSHSIAELAAGLSVDEQDRVSWVVLAARCVECGRIDGLTDLVLQDVSVSEVLAGL